LSGFAFVWFHHSSSLKKLVEGREYKEELRVLEVIGLYSVDGKSKPSMMFDNVAARAGVV
jgi:hypothetical protein